MNFCQKSAGLKIFFRNHYLLVILLFLTFLKGAVWATAVPLFQAPDEQTHYASVQYYAEPENYQPKSNDFPIGKTSLFDIKTQNLSPELRNYLEKTEFGRIRFNPGDITKFSPGSLWGTEEKKVQENQLPRFVESYPAWFTSYSPIYYKICGFLENIFASRSIIDRVFIERLFSVLLTTLTILFAYFIFREINFSKTEAVLAAGIVSFQPMFTFIGASINVDVPLFFGFSVFLFGAMRMLNRKNILTSSVFLLLGASIAILSKPPGYFLIPAAILTGIFFVAQKREKLFSLSRKQKIFSLSMIVLFFAVALDFLWKTMGKYSFALKPLSFYWKYFLFQMEPAYLLTKSRYYWGSFGWLDTPIDARYIYFIWFLLILSLIGIIKIIAKRRDDFAPVLYFSLIVSSFGLMIHFINSSQIPVSNVRDLSGAINIQGRYFFPVIIAKMALIIFGLSALFPFISRKKIIFALFVGMVALNLVGLFDYLIPRFYL